MPPIRGDLWPRGNLLTIIKFSQIKITSLLILCNNKKSVGTKRWYIGFYLNDNGDGTFRVDHLMCAGTGDEIWQRPHGTDDIQDTIEQQIVPVTWNVSSRKPHFVLSDAIEIEDIFRKIC